MAVLIINNQSYSIADDSAILETCERAGVPFNCQSGQCGTCMIMIDEGEQNLYPVNALESDMAMDIYNRLACQCRIKSGVVKINF